MNHDSNYSGDTGAGEKSFFQHIQDSLQPAWENTRKMLFSPFNIKNWLFLSLIAFIAQIINGRGMRFPDFSSILSEKLSDGSINESLLLMYAVGLIIFSVLFIIFWITLLYYSSIFKFVLYESVADGRVSVAPYWERSRKRGKSYFGWYWLLVAAVFIAILIPMIPFVLAAASVPKSGVLPAVGICGLVFYVLFLILAVAAVQAVVDGLAVPAMIGMAPEVSLWAAISFVMKQLWARKKDLLVYLVSVLVLEFALGALEMLLSLIPVMIVGLIAIVPMVLLMITAELNTVLFLVFLVFLICIVFVISYLATCLMVPVIVFRVSFFLTLAGKIFPAYNVMQPAFSAGRPSFFRSAVPGEEFREDVGGEAGGDPEERENGLGGIDLTKRP